MSPTVPALIAGRGPGAAGGGEVAVRVRPGGGGEGADPRPTQMPANCTPGGTLRLNWRGVMLTSAVLEYIVVRNDRGNGGRVTYPDQLPRVRRWRVITLIGKGPGTCRQLP